MTPNFRLPCLRHAGAMGLLLAATFVSAADNLPRYTFTTVAGTSSLGSADGQGEAARFFAPTGVATDSAGNVYLADTGNHTVRKITPTGSVTTFAGSPGRPGSTDGTGTAARFTDPRSVALDSAANIYVADSGNQAIRKITPTGAVTTLAGHPGSVGNSDGTGSLARFNDLLGIAVAPTGDVFVTDAGNHNIRKITPTGEVSTLPGRYDFPEATPYDNNPMPFGAIASDPAGNVYVCHCRVQGEYDPIMPWGMDYSVYFEGTITKITPTGVTSDGPDCWVRIYDDPVHHPVRKEGSFFTGIAFDPGGTMSLNEGPIAFDPTGNLFLADTANNLVLRDDKVIRQNFAGLPVDNATRVVNGVGTAARFRAPRDTAIDSTGNLFVADSHCIRKITPDGDVSLFAGSADLSGTADGASSDARFASVTTLAIDQSDNLYVSDSGSYTIRRVSPSGETTTLAGTPGQHGTDDGTGPAASFFAMSDIAVNSQGLIYVSTYVGLRRITPDGVVTTVSDKLNNADIVDPAGTTQWLSHPGSLAFDQNDNLYIGEFSGEPARTIIHKLAPDGSVSTVFTDNDLRLGSSPTIAVAADGSLYAANWEDHTVLKIVPGQSAITIAGLVDAAGSSDGTGEAARFDAPRGLSLAPDGALYVASSTTIRKGVLATIPVFTEQPASQSGAAGGTVSFSCTATGQPLPTYQWYHNGRALTGATDRTLTLSNLTAGNAGNYTVIAKNDAGETTSSTATLTIGTGSTPSSGNTSGGGGAFGFGTLLSLVALGLGRRLKIRPPSS